MKKIWFYLAASLLVLLSPSLAAAAPLKIGLVISGQIGDVPASFNDICAAGLRNSQTKYAKKIAAHVFNALGDNSMLQQTLDEAAVRSDVVIVAASDFLPYLADVADSYPSVKFATLDPTDVPGVKQAVFREEESAFLAGALAAMMTTQTKLPRINGEQTVGLLLGPDVPPIRRFERGFVAGAWYVDKKVRVIKERTDSFSDASATEVLAKKMVAQGADVIFAVTGAASLGVVQAAAQNHDFWVIGVDSELENTYGRDVLTSAVKRCDLLISRLIDDYVKKQDDDKPFTVGLAEGCADLSLWTRAAKNNIPLSIRNKLEEISNKIEKKLIIIK